MKKILLSVALMFMFVGVVAVNSAPAPGVEVSDLEACSLQGGCFTVSAATCDGGGLDCVATTCMGADSDDGDQVQAGPFVCGQTSCGTVFTTTSSDCAGS